MVKVIDKITGIGSQIDTDAKKKGDDDVGISVKGLMRAKFNQFKAQFTGDVKDGGV